MRDSLRLYGMTRRPYGNWIRQSGIYVGSLLAPAYVAFVSLFIALTGTLPFDPKWLPLTAVFMLERMWTVRRGRPGDVLLAALVLPEWLYEQWRAGVYWLALYKTARGSNREWINA